MRSTNMKGIIIGYKGMIGKRIVKNLRNWVGIGREDNIWDLPKDNYDFIIHLGANCIIREIIKNPKLAKDNIDTTYNVFEFARVNGIKKIIYFSSSRVEHDETNPYVVSKRFGEEMAKAYKECYDIDYLIIRPECVWSEDDKHNRVITNWINNAKNNEDIIVFGDRTKRLSPVYVSDFVNEYLQEQERFLLGDYDKVISISGRALSVTYITDTIKRTLESSSKVIYKEPEISQPQFCNLPNIILDNFEGDLMSIK